MLFQSRNTAGVAAMRHDRGSDLGLVRPSRDTTWMPAQLTDHCASAANPFQSKLMPWPGRIGAKAMPCSRTSGCSI